MPTKTRMSDKPVCLGNPPAKVLGTGCQTCPFCEECLNKKAEILKCFGSYKPVTCQECSKASECKAQAQRNIVARVTKKIPLRVLKETLRQAESLAHGPKTMMETLTRMTVSQGSDVYNSGDVLRGLVEGTLCFEEVSDPTFSNADLDALFKSPVPPPIPWTLPREEDTSDERAAPQDEVTCLNNTGMEDHFDVGITYVFEEHPDDEDMLWVTNKLGQRQEVLKERFQMPPEDTSILDQWKGTPKSGPEDEDDDIPF